MLQMILNQLQTLLENADTPELLISVVNVILQLTKVYPHIFSEYFRVCDIFMDLCFMNEIGIQVEVLT